MRIRNRTSTKQVQVGDVVIGGYNEISIQTMTKCKTSDIEETLKQINEAVNYGADLVRVSILDLDDVNALSQICKEAPCPIIADIHYNYEFAIIAIKNGAKKIRINPGNIGSFDNVKTIIEEAKKYDVAIRIGINSGSLKIDPTGSTAIQLVDCAKQWIKFFEKNKFYKLVISIKDSNPSITIKANKELARFCKYPIHLGITEAGPMETALIKSCAGLVPLLDAGIGNTIRISINGSIKQEVFAARTLLNSMGFNCPMFNIIACPLCGRNLFNTNNCVEQIYKYLQELNCNIKVGIMGCVVNGPGEAKDCDIAICVKTKEISTLYVDRKPIKDIYNKNMIDVLKDEINKWLQKH